MLLLSCLCSLTAAVIAISVAFVFCLSMPILIRRSQCSSGVDAMCDVNAVGFSMIIETCQMISTHFRDGYFDVCLSMIHGEVS